MASSRIFSIFNRQTRFGQFFHGSKWTAITVISWVPGVIFFNDHVAEVLRVNGPSMYPLLNSGYNDSLAKDTCLELKWNAAQNLKRGMIVSFRSPSHPEEVAVKRVIALEGDIVITRAPCPVPKVQVPLNHVWVEGDNRDPAKSLDSNTYGPVPLNLIQGRVTHILSPLSKFGEIRWWEFKGKTRVIRGRREEAPRWD